MKRKGLLLSAAATCALLFAGNHHASGAKVAATNEGTRHNIQSSASLASGEGDVSWAAATSQKLAERIAATPEPSSMMLLGTGLLTSGFLLRRFNFGNEKETQTASAS